MKIKIYSLLILFFVVLLSCSKDEEFKTISPTVIAFKHENGSPILDGECISPNKNYAISITTKSKGNGSFKATKIEYTLNGVLHSMTFTQNGTQINKIELYEGLNTAQIVESGALVTLNYVIQGDFELVE